MNQSKPYTPVPVNPNDTNKYNRIVRDLNDLHSKNELGTFLIGLIETDGNIGFTVGEKQYRPEIRISQNDLVFLAAVANVLNTINNEIKFQYKPGKITPPPHVVERAPRLVCDSWSGSVAIIKLIRTDFWGPKPGFDDFQFCGLGGKSVLLEIIYKIATMIPPQTRKKPEVAQILIDIKENWSIYGKFIRNQFQKERMNYEILKNIPVGSSVGCADDFVQPILNAYGKYEQFQERIVNLKKLSAQDKMKAPNTFKGYLAGTLAGDGSFIVTLDAKQSLNTTVVNGKKVTKPVRNLSCNTLIKVTGSVSEVLNHKYLLTTLGIQYATYPAQQAGAMNTGVSQVYEINKIVKILEHHSPCTQRGVNRFNVLKRLNDLKISKNYVYGKELIYSPDELKEILNLTYSMTTSHGQVRKHSKDVLLNWLFYRTNALPVTPEFAARSKKAARTRRNRKKLKP